MLISLQKRKFHQIDFHQNKSNTLRINLLIPSTLAETPLLGLVSDKTNETY